MILAIRTDAPVVELILCNIANELERYSWEAGRQLAKQLPGEIEQLLARHGADWAAITGIVVYRGPGSFTGLRIGVTVANTLADSINACRIVGVVGDDWLNRGLDRLGQGDNDSIVEPYYGGDAAVTLPKK